MTLSPRRSRLAAAAFSALIAIAAQAQTDPPPPAAPTSPAPLIEPSPPPGAPAAAPESKDDKTPAQPSAMTAEMFYEVLVGELTARSGEPGDGFALLLDAARKARDGKLFQRAVEVALQARSGDAALTAVRAWKEAIPQSREARRFELQILIALNRIGETTELLRAEVAATPEVERPFLMALIARNYGRATDKKLAASVVEQALSDDLKKPGTGGAAWAAVGRLRLAAGDSSGALEAARQGQEMDPSSEGPALLALELIDPAQPLAEPIVKRYLASPKALPEMSMAYARVLVEGHRYADASETLSALTTSHPELAEPWLLLGSLQGQARQDAAAEASLKRYLSLASTQRDPEVRDRGQTQAYLLLSQLAERRKDFTAADSWLARIDNPEDLFAAQARRAALLARQGKMPQARELVRSLPERTPDEKKLKFQAEVQLLRDAKQYQAAYDMLVQAELATPNDPDLIYDQAMMAEKLNRLDEMERLLRRLIELKPDNQNAYNALGYSFADRKVRLDEARTLIQKAVQLAPEDPFIADSLGWVEFRLGNMPEATRILETAYKSRPDPEIGAHLGEVLWTAGERERAISIWKEASLVDANNETLQETLKRLRVKL
ncbi:putative PEP-CTERM system TPR-repeat lipoprotein [Variovorax sp. SRS16]|uniref:tetratricopeptide repeat protein n=1 Tax=Variovorax sp. SRS16 TaxID=282217 RepID=UPI001315F354|nr:tetratricopeptide repeat protein [Variovorax sp. SRS16]VTU28813.1 putative PEP-CTERM system TPR-repeat lipoprotein [Variovorax sp. SRS16]